MKTLAPQKTLKIGIQVLALLFISLSSLAQTTYKQTGTPSVLIAGTSTMHDWTMESKQSNYTASFEINADGTPAKLNSVSVVIPAESLKSKEKAMDKNAYNSLKTDKYKEITYQLTTSKITGKTITCSGNLTIAGTTKPLDVDVTYEVVNGTMVIKGSKKIKMTDFKVEPPTFMFGAIKTGDEITISINVTLAPVKL
jgi:polyisoprenoid-binding protein YceI